MRRREWKPARGGMVAAACAISSPTIACTACSCASALTAPPSSPLPLPVVAVVAVVAGLCRLAGLALVRALASPLLLLRLLRVRLAEEDAAAVALRSRAPWVAVLALVLMML